MRRHVSCTRHLHFHGDAHLHHVAGIRLCRRRRGQQRECAQAADAGKGWQGMDMLRLGLKSDSTGSTHTTTVIASTATTLADRNRYVRRLVESRLTTSCQLVLATRSRSRVPGHQIPGATGQRGSGFSVPNDFSEQHPCKQRHSTPEGGMRKKRLHVDPPELPLPSRWVDPSKLSRYMHIKTPEPTGRTDRKPPAKARLYRI